MINRILDSWSFLMNFMKYTGGWLQLMERIRCPRSKLFSLTYIEKERKNEACTGGIH